VEEVLLDIVSYEVGCKRTVSSNSACRRRSVIKTPWRLNNLDEFDVKMRMFSNGLLNLVVS
jgi:hypothetical protein